MHVLEAINLSQQQGQAAVMHGVRVHVLHVVPSCTYPRTCTCTLAWKTGRFDVIRCVCSRVQVRSAYVQG